MKVSVLIGSRNRPEALHRCLTSILNQDYADLQILVLDDNSDQMRLDEIVRAAFPDPRLHCFRSEQPLGVAAGRNFLMQQADGDVFCVLDDDACFTQADAISHFMDSFKEYPQAGILAFFIIDQDTAEAALHVPFSQRSLKQDPGLLTKSGLVSYYLGGGHALRRTVIEQCGAYRDDLTFGQEELDLSYRVIEGGFQIIYLPQIVIHHYPEPSVLDGQGKLRHKELYFFTRNRFFIAYRYLPAKYVPIYLGMRLAKQGLEAIRARALGQYFGGILAGLKMLPHIERTPLSPHAVAYLEANYGRLWY